jgi:hypothetical protein
MSDHPNLCTDRRVVLQEEPSWYMDAATASGCCYLFFVKVTARTMRSDSDFEPMKKIIKSARTWDLGINLIERIVLYDLGCMWYPRVFGAYVALLL